MIHAPPTIAGYKILEKLGEGATAVVWKAHQLSLDRTVVIKVLADQLSKDSEDVKRFVAEAQTAAKLKYAGIVQIYDFGQTRDDGRYFLVMEYVSGYTVGDWARRRGRLREPDAIIIAHYVGEALKYAWNQARIIHCDIKPDNLMVDTDGTIKVMDLGLAHMVFAKGVAAAVQNNDMIMGTPNYMAPEQAVGSNNLDCRTDIYALGMTLYHILTGILPYGIGEALAIMEKQIKETLPDPRTINPDLSAEIAGIISKMTAKNIADRYQNWNEALAALSVLLHQKSDQVAPPSPAAKKQTAPSADYNSEFKECPYCAESIKKNAVYCRFCGKDLEKLLGRNIPQEKKTSGTLRLKPVAMPESAQAKTAPEPPTGAFKKKLARWAGNARIVLTVIFIGFLIYYWFVKIRYERDILKPWKTKLSQRVITPLAAAGYALGERVKNIFENQPAEDDTRDLPQNTPEP